MIYLTTFTNNLLPILILTAAGFLLGKFLKVDPQPIGKILFYILTPALIFTLLTKNALEPGKIVLMMGFALVVMSCAGVLAFLAGKLLRLNRSALIAVILTSMLANNGNYGLPLITFAFGEAAQAYSTVYFVTSAMMAYSVGALIASLDHLDLKGALLGLVKVPSIYAILLAILFITTGWTLPVALDRPISLAASGAVPAMIVLLGVELSGVEWSSNLKTISIPVIIRLVISPLIAYSLVGPFGFKGPALQAGVTEAAMSSAVSTTVLASQYKLERHLINAIIFTTTILSPLTLTPLLVFLSK